MKILTELGFKQTFYKQLKKRRLQFMESIKNQLEKLGYDYAVAIATQSEIESGAACGQLAIIGE